MNLDLGKSQALLAQAGYPVNSEEFTLENIGRKYGVPPQRIYETIKSAKTLSAPKEADNKSIPASPPPGTGNLTLADFCARFNLNVKKVVRELTKSGTKASEALTIKKIAEDNNTSPNDIYERIKGVEKLGSFPN
jgi:predicted DNA-binding protein YlxM (UPF0122 family)